jgi:hypothetical protein
MVTLLLFGRRIREWIIIYAGFVCVTKTIRLFRERTAVLAANGGGTLLHWISHNDTEHPE